MKALPVLVVEDDQDLLEAICATMKLAGYQALAASSGYEAMAVLQECQVGIVVSDVQMKPMDGLTLLNKIKAFNPELPVLLMTAYREIDKAVAAMRSGACDYLLKPFSEERLEATLKRVKEQIRNQENQTNCDVWNFADWCSGNQLQRAFCRCRILAK